MSRKQGDYLAGLLDDGEDEAPSPARVRRSPLLERESALARVASGEIRQVTELRLDPARCRIWPGNGRAYAELSETRCRDLIDSLISEGGQKVPAVVRRIADREYEYEVVAGTRRHWSISWLRTHNYPDMLFVAQVVDLDDEAAFRLADVENRARADLSDFERARNYALALDAHYGGVQARMAERLKISRGWLSKLLTMASLPDEVVAAFPDMMSIPVRGGYELAVKATGPERGVLISMAVEIAAKQQSCRVQGLPLLDGATVLRRLLTADLGRVGAKGEAVLVSAADGRPALTLQGRRGGVLTMRLDTAAKVDRAALVEGFIRALEDTRT